jgi:hypothetical protein
MEVGATGTEDLRLREIPLDVHDQCILATHCQQISLVGIEFHCVDGSFVNGINDCQQSLGAGIGILGARLDHLLGIPQRNTAVAHAACYEAEGCVAVLAEIVPCQAGEGTRCLRLANEAGIGGFRGIIRVDA